MCVYGRVCIGAEKSEGRRKWQNEFGSFEALAVANLRCMPNFWGREGGREGERGTGGGLGFRIQGFGFRVPFCEHSYY